jgi:hypothetical protein
VVARGDDRSIALGGNEVDKYGTVGPNTVQATVVDSQVDRRTEEKGPIAIPPASAAIGTKFRQASDRSRRQEPWINGRFVAQSGLSRRALVVGASVVRLRRKGKKFKGP